MKIILLKDVKGVGKRYEEKELAEGYALNFLIPKKFAVVASSAAANQIKNLKENEAKHKQTENQKLDEEIHRLANSEIKIELKTNEQNHLFAALTKSKIIEILQQKGFNISETAVEIEHSIKEAGDHNITLKAGDKLTHFTLSIVSK